MGLTNAAVLDDANKPPIAITVVKEDHGIAFCGICLALDRCDKGVQGVDEFKINVLCKVSAFAAQTATTATKNRERGIGIRTIFNRRRAGDFVGGIVIVIIVVFVILHGTFLVNVLRFLVGAILLHQGRVIMAIVVRIWAVF